MYKTTKYLVNKYNFNFKKKFGQNFLIDENTLDLIVDNAQVNCNDYILEIGPGVGSLTQRLCHLGKEVVAFEIDNSLVKILETEIKADNFRLVHDDFMKVNLEEMLDENRVYKVVANLPYYITTPILFKLIEEKVQISSMYVMMQKEVGERLSARQNTKQYNALTVIMQTFYDVQIVQEILRNSFMPAPNVDSVVVELKKKDRAYNQKFADFVKLFFKYKRKNLRNNLKGLDLEKMERILKQYDYNLTLRAEQISVVHFWDIYKEFVGE